VKRIIAFFVLAISFAFSFSAFAVTSPEGFIGGGSSNLMTKVNSHVILPATLAHERCLSSTDSLIDRKETDSERPTNNGLLSYPVKSITPVAGGLRAGSINTNKASV